MFNIRNRLVRTKTTYFILLCIENLYCFTYIYIKKRKHFIGIRHRNSI